MLFKKKNLIEILQDEVYKQSDLLNELRSETYKLNQAITYIQNKLNDNSTCLIQIYHIDNNIYGIFLNERKVFYTNTIYEIVTYNLTNDKKVCTSSAEESKNKLNSKIVLELVDIDNHSSFECQKGHASKHIDIYKQICKKHNIDSFYGILYTNTPIGLDNLMNFYKKNGFIIKNSKFYINFK